MTIWHYKDEIPDFNREFMYIYDDNSKYIDKFTSHTSYRKVDEEVVKWCYTDDLLTQDKLVEGLQQKLDTSKYFLEYISNGEVRYLDILNCYNTKQATKKELKEFARQALKTIRGE